MRTLVFALIAPILMIYGCSDEGENVCTPGATQICSCAGGKQGAQTCDKDGKAWGPCTGCSTFPDGGVPDIKVTSPDSRGVPDKPKPDMREDVGLSCEVNGSKIGEKFVAICQTKKATCNGSPVQYGVNSHNLQYKNGKALTFVCSSMGTCATNETLDKPQDYSITFAANGGSKNCGTATVTGKVK